MREPGLAVFDLDHTLIRKNSSFEFTRFLFRRGELPLRSLFLIVGLYLIYKVLPNFICRLHHLAFKAVYRGMSLTKLTKLAEEFWDLYLKEWIYPELATRVAQAKSRGLRTLLLSNSPHFFVQIAGEKMGIDQAQGSEYSLRDGDKLEAIQRMMDGAGKASFVKSMQVAEAYTDSISDLPLLQQAVKPIAVNPDHRLKEVCLRNCWEIIITH